MANDAQSRLEASNDGACGCAFAGSSDQSITHR